VLIVEDEYFVSMQIEGILLDMGCEVVGSVATAEEALEVAAREKPTWF
jgi:DNA-binding NarL/FixJ family response regulator